MAPDNKTAEDEDFDTELDGTVEDDDVDNADDDSAVAGDDDKYVAPTESEYRKMQRALKRANTQAKKLREEGTAKPKGEEVDTDAVKAEGRTEAEGIWKPRYVNQAAKAAFAQAGLKGTADKLLRLIDMDDIEIDDDGQIDGLDEQVRDIKREYPAMFAGRASKDVDAGSKDAKEVGKSSADIIAQRLTGSSR